MHIHTKVHWNAVVKIVGLLFMCWFACHDCPLIQLAAYSVLS